MKTKITFGFKGKNQLPLFMIIKEYYNDNGDIEFAKVLFQIKGRAMRKLEKKLGITNKRKRTGKWITSYMGCVINCSNCGERLELCYPDGTEVRALPYCPYCGAKMMED